MNTELPSKNSIGGFILLFILAVGIFPIISSAEPELQPRIIVESDAIKHLKFDYTYTNKQYRNQLLEITPIGTSFSEVTAFVRTTLKAERHPSDSIFMPEIASQPNSISYINWATRMNVQYYDDRQFSPRDLEGQPPFARVVSRTGAFLKGTKFINPDFTAKPVWTGRWIELSVFYVFGPGDKLIDIYCISSGRHLTGP